LTLRHPVYISPDNKHSASCGKPGTVDGGAWGFSSYFENAHGEQWIATAEKGYGFITIRGGDIAWGTICHFDGSSFRDQGGGLLIIEDEVALWAQACYLTMQRRNQ